MLGKFTFLISVPRLSRDKGLGQEPQCPLPSKCRGRLQSCKCVCCQRSVQRYVGARSPVLVLREPEHLVAAGYLKLELRLSVYAFWPYFHYSIACGSLKCKDKDIALKNVSNINYPALKQLLGVVPSCPHLKLGLSLSRHCVSPCLIL